MMFVLRLSLVFLLLLVSCANLTDQDSHLTVEIQDLSGKVEKCNLRIIEREPNREGKWHPENIETHMLNHPTEVSYTFENLPEGDWACLVGNISETYTEFSIKDGDHLQIVYTYSPYTDVTVGNWRSGYYTMPLYRWRSQVIKVD